MHGAVHLLECRSISDGGHENFTPFTPWKIFACLRTNGSNTHTLFSFKSFFGTDPIQSIYQSVTLVNITNNKKQQKHKKKRGGVFLFNPFSSSRSRSSKPRTIQSIHPIHPSTHLSSVRYKGSAHLHHSQSTHTHTHTHTHTPIYVHAHTYTYMIHSAQMKSEIRDSGIVWSRSESGRTAVFPFLATVGGGGVSCLRTGGMEGGLLACD